MFRKLTLSALAMTFVVAELASAQVRPPRENRERAREHTQGARPNSGAGMRSTNRTVEVQAIASKAARNSTSMRETAEHLEDISRSSGRYFEDGKAPEGFNKLMLEVEASKDSAGSYDKALETALNRRGITKEELKEKCKPL